MSKSKPILKKAASSNSLADALGTKSVTVKAVGGLSVFKPPSSGGTKPSPAAVTAAPEKVVKVPSPLETPAGMSDFMSLDVSVRLSHVDRLVACITSSDGSFGSSANNSAISDLVAICVECGLSSLEGQNIVNFMVKTILTAGSAGRSLEGGLFLLQELLKSLGRGVEPFSVPLLSRIFTAQADRSGVVRDIGANICKILAGIVSPHAFRIVFPMLTAAMKEEDWKIKVAALSFLKEISPRAGLQISPMIPQIIPAVNDCISDIKKEVKSIALEALKEVLLALILTQRHINLVVTQPTFLYRHVNRLRTMTSET